MAKPFIKAADTSVSVTQSRSEVEKLLLKYGAVGVSFAAQYDDSQRTRKVTVEFLVPSSTEKNAPKVPVRLPVDIWKIYDALYGRPITSKWNEKHVWPDGTVRPGYDKIHNPAGYNTAKLEKAERVAWRNLKLWIEAALAATTAGLQTVAEAFFAHTLVQLENGSVARMTEYVEMAGGSLAPGVRALLPSSTGNGNGQ